MTMCRYVGLLLLVLAAAGCDNLLAQAQADAQKQRAVAAEQAAKTQEQAARAAEIGRASCRERVYGLV